MASDRHISQATPEPIAAWISPVARILEKLRDAGRLMPPLDPIMQEIIEAVEGATAPATPSEGRFAGMGEMETDEDYRLARQRPAPLTIEPALLEAAHARYLMAMAILQSPLYAKADDELRQAVDESITPEAIRAATA